MERDRERVGEGWSCRLGKSRKDAPLSPGLAVGGPLSTTRRFKGHPGAGLFPPLPYLVSLQLHKLNRASAVSTTGHGTAVPAPPPPAVTPQCPPHLSCNWGGC